VSGEASEAGDMRATRSGGLMQTEELERHWYWRDSQLNVAAYPTEEPADPEVGAAWFSSATNCLYIWDGVEWICVPLD
jgi:hypothetical protein